MAIKGKKKSQTRGSQARRRPATAPRAAGGTRPAPWYHTTSGRVMLAVVGAVVLGGVMWAVANAQASARDLRQRQRALDQFTGQIRAVLDMMNPVTAEMATVPETAAGPDVVKLQKDTTTWLKSLQQVRTQLSGIPVLPSVETASRVFASSVEQYVAAANAYQLAATVERDVQRKALVQAAAQRDQAAALWLTAVDALDRARSAAELGPSALQPPVVMPPQPAPEVSPEPDGGGDGGGPNDGGG